MDWQAIAALAAACVAAGATGRHIYGWINHESTVAARANSAEGLATAAIAKLEMFGRELSDHRVEDAKQFARLETMTTEASRAQLAAETRMTNAIQEVSRELRAMGSRIDRFLEIK